MIHITYTRKGKPYECSFRTAHFASKWIKWALSDATNIKVVVEWCSGLRKPGTPAAARGGQ